MENTNLLREWLTESMAKHDKAINIQPKICHAPFWTTTSEQQCWHQQGSYEHTKRGDVYDIFLYMTVTQHERPEVHYRKQYANISSYKQFCSVKTMSDTLLFFNYHLTWQFIQWVLIKLAQAVILLTCTMERPSMNLCWDTEKLDFPFFVVSQSSPANTRLVPQIRL